MHQLITEESNLHIDTKQPDRQNHTVDHIAVFALHAGLCGNLASLHTSAFNVTTIFSGSNDNVTTPLVWACKRYDNEPVVDNEHLILQCI